MKKILSIIALILALAGLAVSVMTYQKLHDATLRYDAQIDALVSQNLELQAQLEALSSQTDALELGATTLTGSPWADGQGADVTLTLQPLTYQEGNTALLQVLLDDQVVTDAGCQWDGTMFTGTVQVPAGNGYTYTVICGEVTYTLASPQNPVYPELVYLADSVNSYCNLVIEEWSIKENVLTLDACYAQIQTPLLSTAGPLTCTAAQIVLKNGETVLDTCAVSMEAGEGEGSYESRFTGLSLTLPELTEGEQVDLWMEATLSDGRTITAWAGTWYAMASGFSMAAG